MSDRRLGARRHRVPPVPRRQRNLPRLSGVARRARWSLVLPLALVAVVLSSTAALTAGSRPPPPRSPLAPSELTSGSSIAAAAESLSRGAGPAQGSPWDCRYVGASTSASCTAAPAAPASTGWVRDGPGPDSGAFPRAVYMVYDARDGYVVLLVGETNASGPTSTWTYSDGGWTLLIPPGATPVPQPDACQGSAVAYDAVDDYVLLFESENCNDAGQTWAFSAGAWTQLEPARSAPVEGNYTWMGTIPQREEVLLFEENLADPWAFSNGTWSAVPPSNASPGGDGVLTYDSADGAVLDFATYVLDDWVNETWEYRAGQWTEVLASAGPSPRLQELLVDDRADGYVLLVGGYSATNQLLHDVWTFHAGVWTNLSASAPRVVEETTDGYAAAATFDPGLSGVAFLAVAEQAGAANATLLWTFHGGTWTNLSTPSPPSRPVDDTSFTSYLTYDPADGYAVLLTDQGRTWTFENGVWAALDTSVQPPPGPMSYDNSSGYVVLVAGGSSTAETWEFVGGSWAELTPLLSPPVCSTVCSTAYDPLEGYVLYVTGGAAGANTWEFQNGTWANLTGTLSLSPDGGPANSIVYDPALDGVVLPGTSTYVVNVTTGPNITNRTWLFTRGAWEELSPSSDLGPLVEHASVAYDPTAGGVVLFGGEVLESGSWNASAVTILLVGSTWTRVVTPVDPGARYGAAIAFGPSLGGVLLFGGENQSPEGLGLNDWWTWTPPGAEAGPVVEAVEAEPNPVEVGVDLTIGVTVAGGTPPLSYVYTGLPAGCPSENASQLTCAPSAAGSFSVSVNVADARGNRSAGSTGLVVLADVSIPTFVATPATVAVGVRSLLEVDATGGTSPYTYAYSALPAGCFSQDVPILPCVPQASGSYTPTVDVTDAEGVVAVSHTGLTVLAAGIAGGPSITSFTVTPQSVVLGNGTMFAVDASDGSVVLGYAYSGLPPGCSSSNASAFSCVPSVAGAYAVTAWVTTPSGLSAESNLTLDVTPVGGGPDPLVQAFVATPGSLTVGNSTVLEVEVGGPAASFTFSYQGLPAGCASSNTSRLPCTPHEAGVFTVTAVVTGAHGNRTSVPTVLTVTPVAGRAPPPSPALWYWVALGLLAGGVAALAASWSVVRYRAARSRAEGEAWIRQLQHEGTAPPDGDPKR